MSVIHSGSSLSAEMSRTTCSDSPLSNRIVAFSGSWKPKEHGLPWTLIENQSLQTDFYFFSGVWKPKGHCLPWTLAPNQCQMLWHIEYSCGLQPWRLGLGSPQDRIYERETDLRWQAGGLCRAWRLLQSLLQRWGRWWPSFDHQRLQNGHKRLPKRRIECWQVWLNNALLVPYMRRKQNTSGSQLSQNLFWIVQVQIHFENTHAARAPSFSFLHSTLKILYMHTAACTFVDAVYCLINGTIWEYFTVIHFTHSAPYICFPFL